MKQLIQVLRHFADFISSARHKKYWALALTSMFFFIALGYACNDVSTSSDNGTKAAKEFCNCLDDGNSVSKCSNDFHDKYGNSFDDDFINAFNKEGDKCGITATKQ